MLERLTGLDPAVTTITLTPVEAAGEVGDEEVTVSVGDVPQGLGLLVVKRGPNAGSRFVLGTGKTTIGRHPDSDIFLDDVTVSRRHAEIYHDDDAFTAVDVGSLNGTYLNRERIERPTCTAVTRSRSASSAWFSCTRSREDRDWPSDPISRSVKSCHCSGRSSRT